MSDCILTSTLEGGGPPSLCLIKQHAPPPDRSAATTLSGFKHQRS